MHAQTLILTTGGTIDSSPAYDPTKKSVFDGTYIPTKLAQARVHGEVRLEALMQKDSADLTVSDRALIGDRCAQTDAKRIVITHGTDTIAETAQYLGTRGIAGKTIVLVGAFVPHSQENSDAFFNLGYAIAAAQLLPEGVWVAMGAEVFEWNNVRKNKGAGKFEQISPRD